LIAAPGFMIGYFLGYFFSGDVFYPVMEVLSYWPPILALLIAVVWLMEFLVPTWRI
jgi:hypothetical protein